MGTPSFLLESFEDKRVYLERINSNYYEYVNNSSKRSEIKATLTPTRLHALFTDLDHPDFSIRHASCRLLVEYVALDKHFQKLCCHINGFLSTNFYIFCIPSRFYQAFEQLHPDSEEEDFRQFLSDIIELESTPFDLTSPNDPRLFVYPKPNDSNVIDPQMHLLAVRRRSGERRRYKRRILVTEEEIQEMEIPDEYSYTTTDSRVSSRPASAFSRQRGPAASVIGYTTPIGVQTSPPRPSTHSGVRPSSALFMHTRDTMLPPSPLLQKTKGMRTPIPKKKKQKKLLYGSHSATFSKSVHSQAEQNTKSYLLHPMFLEQKFSSQKLKRSLLGMKTLMKDKSRQKKKPQKRRSPKAKTLSMQDSMPLHSPRVPKTPRANDSYSKSTRRKRTKGTVNTDIIFRFQKRLLDDQSSYNEIQKQEERKKTRAKKQRFREMRKPANALDFKRSCVPTHNLTL
ncbi:hypothetical protein PCE1_001032 [Barthelona sp. PCE]